MNSRIRKKGGTICAEQWKESRRAATSAAGVCYRFNVYRTNDICAVALRRLDSRFRTFDESVLETGGGKFGHEKCAPVDFVPEI